jgi:5-deoxy-D-glucuronate isomerase
VCAHSELWVLIVSQKIERHSKEQSLGEINIRQSTLQRKPIDALYLREVVDDSELVNAKLSKLKVAPNQPDIYLGALA